MCLQMFLSLWKQNRMQHICRRFLKNNGACVCLNFWHFDTIQKTRLNFLCLFNLKWRILFKSLPIQKKNGTHFSHNNKYQVHSSRGCWIFELAPVISWSSFESLSIGKVVLKAYRKYCLSWWKCDPLRGEIIENLVW
jgi:hypothetical protein